VFIHKPPNTTCIISRRNHLQGAKFKRPNVPKLRSGDKFLRRTHIISSQAIFGKERTFHNPRCIPFLIMETSPQPPGGTVASAPASVLSQPHLQQKITRGHSCILCQQRKVKCDRQKPCSNCIRAHAECIPSQPSAPRRRRRKLSELDVAARLRKYEHLLRVNGIKIEDDGVAAASGGSGGEDAEESTSSRQEKPSGQTASSSTESQPLQSTMRPHEHRGSKAGKGQLFSTHGHSRYIEK
jgi:hypothetical protein